MFCLPLPQRDRFIEALKEGTIDPSKLSDMTSQERHKFFSDLIGEEDARQVNALFESKLLLKNQQQGMITWAKTVASMKPEIRRDIISQIERLNTVLDPKEEKVFLQDLASKRLGANVSFEEAQKIIELSSKVSETKVNVSRSEGDRLMYGAARVELTNYVNELKLESKKLTIGEKVGELKTEPGKAVGRALSDLAGLAKGIKASLDDSAIFRQGWRTVFTNPEIWADNAAKSFVDIAKQVTRSDDQIMNGIKADIYSRPLAIDRTYDRMKLDIGMNEEAFPTQLPEKIPLFGRLYKASEVAYSGFLMRMRADIADKLIGMAKDTGVDLTDNFQLRSIGKMINSLTGRGSLGSLEQVGKHINTIFFSPKMVKSSFDFLTVHTFEKMSPFARKQAALNLLKVASGMALILGTAKALKKDSVEFDPRSADFGKVKIGDTRFDVSGGMSSMVTLAARLLTLSSKSSVTGKVTLLNSGKYGAQTGTDVFVNWLENKLSPAAAIVKDLLNQRDFQGNKITPVSEITNLLVPLPITNIQELNKDPNSANVLIATIADMLGIATNTYGRKTNH